MNSVGASAPVADQAPAPPAAQPVAKPGLREWWWLSLTAMAYGVNQIDRNILNVVQEQVKHEFGLTDVQLGSLSGLAFGFVYALSAVGMGLLADRTNRRNLLAGVLTVWSLLTASCAIVRGFPALLAARMAVAAAESGTTPASSSMISDWFPAGRRSTAMAIYYLGPPAGTIASYAFGGLIAERYGWRAAFLVAGAPGLLLAALLLATCPQPRRGAGEATQPNEISKGGLTDALRHMWRVPRLRLVVLSVLLATMGSTSFGAWVSSFLIRQHHMTVATAGQTVALCIGVASLVGILIGGPVAERVSRGRPTLGFAAALVTVATMAVAVAILSPATGPALAGLALFGTLFMAYIAPCFSTVLDGTPPHLRGVAISIVMLVANLIGGAMGPVLVGFISDHVGGAQALRWGLVTVIPEFLGTAILLLCASRAALSAPSS